MISWENLTKRRNILLLFLFPIFPLAAFNAIGIENYTGVFTDYVSGLYSKVGQFLEF